MGRNDKRVENIIFLLMGLAMGVLLGGIIIYSLLMPETTITDFYQVNESNLLLSWRANHDSLVTQNSIIFSSEQGCFRIVNKSVGLLHYNKGDERIVFANINNSCNETILVRATVRTMQSAATKQIMLSPT